MNTPKTFDTSWKEAERRAFERLIEATSAEENKGAFLARNPGVMNAWHFESQPVVEVGESVFLAKDLPTMGIPYRAIGVFLSREDCQIFVMSVIRGLPLHNDEASNIHMFRMTGLGKITFDKITLQNEKAVLAWSVQIDFDLVFITGGKNNTVI